MNRFFPGLVVVLAVSQLHGCAATIIPPENPPNPRPAFVLDHGRHTTLVVVDSGGRPVRYAFGELGWYTDGQIGIFRGMGAMLLPASGTLGRRVLEGKPSASNVLQRVGVNVEHLYCIAVDGERADELQRMLNSIFKENLATARYHSGWNLEFVEHPADYWFGQTSNQAVENWLVKLGSEVTGVTAFAKWKVQQPPGAAPAVCVDSTGE